MSPSVLTLFEDAAAVLARDKAVYMSIYTKYKHSPQWIPHYSQLHEQNKDLIWLAAEVAFDRCLGDVHRLQMSRHVCPVNNDEVLGCVLFLLCKEKKTFEEFCIFAKARQLTKTAESPVRSLSHLLDDLPTCMRHLLWSDCNSKGFQLVNQFFQQSLCNLNSMVFVGGPTNSELLWGLSVDPATSLASFQLKTAFGCTGCKLSVQNGDVCIIAYRQDGCQWKIKAVDDTHIKIYTEKGLKLAA